jgi:Methyltransferase FkbM domain
MRSLTKLANNFSRRAIGVLGPARYAQYLRLFMQNLPKIFSSGDLRPLDQAMGLKGIERFHYCDYSFLFDCKYCDDLIHDGSFAFGIVREIYIRNCYFKFHTPDVFATARTVLDLGANRGSFSVLMATHADYVISVEAISDFVPVIEHNMRINRYTNYAIECGFVGNGGMFENSSFRKLTIDSILEQHNMDHVDFLKMDIEGSEFELFSSHGWLERVTALSMEVHSDYGDPRSVLDALVKHKFGYTIADVDLTRVDDVRRANFIYARRIA